MGKSHVIIFKALLKILVLFGLFNFVLFLFSLDVSYQRYCEDVYADLLVKRVGCTVPILVDSSSGFQFLTNGAEDSLVWLVPILLRNDTNRPLVIKPFAIRFFTWDPKTREALMWDSVYEYSSIWFKPIPPEKSNSNL